MKKIRIRLSTFLVFTCVTGVLAGLVVRRSHRQHKSREELVRSGFSLAFDPASRTGEPISLGFGGSYTPKDKPIGSYLDQPDQVSWLTAIGLGEFDNPIELVDGSRNRLDHKAFPGFVDSDLGPLKNLPAVKELRLSWNSISDKGLEHISGLSSLRCLELDGCPIGDEGLKHLSNLKNLERLSLAQTDITDAGIKHLVRLKRIKYLNLEGNRLSGPAIRWASSLPELQTLSLSRTDVDQTMVSNLKKLDLLTELYLSETDVSSLNDVLPKLQKLNWLGLNGTKIGDDTIYALRGIQLSGLCVEDTQVTSAAFDAISNLEGLEYFEGYGSGLSYDEIELIEKEIEILKN